MKKIYLQPETCVISIQSINIIADSLIIDPGQGGGGALVKEEYNAWDIWGEEVEVEE